MTPVRKILTVFGTRPEAVKMAPVIRKISHTPGLTCIVAVTAQHREMLDQVLEDFEIDACYDLDLMQDRQDLPGLTARVLTATTDIVRESMPDLVLVHGDTTTTFAASLAAFYARIPVGHVEAGLRTGDRYSPFPEEMNRRLTSSLGDLHFAPTPRAKANLIAESVPEHSIAVCGNTAIDSLLFMVKKNDESKGSSLPGRLISRIEGKRIVLITAHRRESFGKGFERICRALRELCKRFPETIFLYPVHLNPNVRNPVREMLGGIENMILTEPLPYRGFVDLMSRAYLILTDSGGIQEEAPSLGIPVLVLREVTERPEAVEAGTVRLVGTDVSTIVREASRLLEDEQRYSLMSRRINPYGDGFAAERIVDAILSWFGRESFYRKGDFS